MHQEERHVALLLKRALRPVLLIDRADQRQSGIVFSEFATWPSAISTLPTAASSERIVANPDVNVRYGHFSVARIPPAMAMARFQHCSPRAATILFACCSAITGYSGNSICL
jgi:hypothetical protein